MFAVIFEVCPIDTQWETYLGEAGIIRPELEQIDGFISNVRYRSLSQAGWLLSFSIWRDEKALIRWRTHALHHRVQAKARSSIFHDYHLRVGKVVADSVTGGAVRASRYEATEIGAGKIASFIEAPSVANNPVAGFVPVTQDAFEAILTPGAGVWLVTSRDEGSLPPMSAAPGTRRRDILVIRDYGMSDRREAPQYFPETAPVASNG